MEDAPVEEKQAFLRENILEKGYDINHFVEFLTSKKGEEGADIANWTLNDLHSVVNEFISNNTPQLEQQIEPENNFNENENNNQLEEKKSKTVIIKKNKPLIESNNDEWEEIEKLKATTIKSNTGKKN